MQFVDNGPDIPGELLADHEEGRIVFFCGAGISIPAGLPGFKELVNDIYRELGTERTALEESAYRAFRYDLVLDELEHRLPGQRDQVRTLLVDLFRPEHLTADVLKTHEALLCLGHSREGTLRLVTTNFDSIFELAAKHKQYTFTRYAAPLLPIPKNCRWNGLVYLHGRLPHKPEMTALNNVVLTSGDFGRAYLTECWAARFVRDLLRNYEVCFVGYSLRDPVLRYMLDALAADRMQGEYTPKVWAFGDSLPELDSAKREEWEAKGVIPILYDKRNDHAVLHQTLRIWAETYQQATEGRASIIRSFSTLDPAGSTCRDNYAGRVFWALSDPSGYPAQCFSELEPVPSLDWLLLLFSGDEAENSLFSRLARSFGNIWMPFVTDDPATYPWNEVAEHLSRWFLRFLNDPRLLVWLSGMGGCLNPRFRSKIEKRLRKIEDLQISGDEEQLSLIRKVSPQAVPCAAMRKLWNILLSGQMEQIPRGICERLSLCCQRFERDGVTSASRAELRSLLAPRIFLTRALLLFRPLPSGQEPSIDQLVDWQLVLGNQVCLLQTEDKRATIAKKNLWRLLPDFIQLLTDSLGLLEQIGEMLPSFSDFAFPETYPDNLSDKAFPLPGNLNDLIAITWQSWIGLKGQFPSRAQAFAQFLKDSPFFLLRQMADAVCPQN